MKKTINTDDDIPAEIDFSGAVRGKYAKRYAEGTNVVLLEPDVYEVFPDSDAVNAALRVVMRASAKVKPARRRKAS